MNSMLKGPYAGFLGMVFTFLGIVLWVTLFSSILAQFDSLIGYANLSQFTLLKTLYQIGPVLVFLGVLGLLGWGYASSFNKSKQGSGINFLMWIVFAALQIILFLSLFPTIVTSLYTVLTDSSISQFIALSTVVQISAAIIFLGGLFAAGLNVATGVGARKKGKSSQNA